MTSHRFLVLLSLLIGSCASAANNPFSSKPSVPVKAPMSIQANKGADILASSKESAIPLPVDLPPPPVPSKSPSSGGSRQSISKQPTECNLELLRQKQPLQISAAGGALEILLRARGHGCTRGAMANDDWLSVSSFSDTKVVVQAAPNVSSQERVTTLVVAATAESEGATLTVTQAGQSSGSKGVQP